MIVYLLSLMVGMVICELPSEWAYEVLRDGTITLYCNDSSINIDTNEYGQWTIPSGVELKKQHNDSLLTVQQENGIEGFSLLLKKVESSLDGVYICKVKSVSTDVIRMATIRGINLHQPLAKSASERYEYNIIVAVVASVVFLVPLLGACAIYKFRYKSPEDKSKKYNVRHREYPNNVSMESPNEVKVPPSDSEQYVYENAAASTNL